MALLFIALALVAAPLDCSAQSRPEGLSWRSETTELALSSGKKIVATLRIPERSKKNPLPALVIFGGFEEAGKVLELVSPTDPIILASFDYPFSAPRKLSFPGSLVLLPQAKRMIHETLEGARLLGEFLAKRADVDSEKISILGASFGAPFAIVVASQSPEVYSSLVLIHAFADVPATASYRLKQVWEARYGIVARPIADALVSTLWLYANAPNPTEAAEKLLPGQMVLVIEAEEDDMIPKASRQDMLNRIRRSSAEVAYKSFPGGHLHPGAYAMIRDLMKEVTAWMFKKNILDRQVLDRPSR